ncbi:MAG: hypothetical protein M3Z17_07240 [Gemmatimonadota bacterium]|nr:hypothetical protein [Gemmatimonadota bacterium]
MLIRFWIRRFVRIFLIVAAALLLVERLKGGSDYTSVALWSAIAGVVSASLATYWAYKKSCGLPPRAG